MWRVVEDEVGGYLVEVVEAWAVGYRKDSEVYAEIQARVDSAGSSPKTKALTDVLAMYTKPARDLRRRRSPRNRTRCHDGSASRSGTWCGPSR